MSKLSCRVKEANLMEGVVCGDFLYESLSDARQEKKEIYGEEFIRRKKTDYTGYYKQ